MKWLAFLLVVFTGIIVGLSSAGFAASSGGVAIESISHAVVADNEEKLTFKLGAQVAPKIFTMKGDNPRLVLDFLNSSYAGKGNIPLPEGKLATTIRTGSHQAPEQKIRVVVDLAKNIAVRHTSEYSEADRILTVRLSADSKEQSSKEMLPAVKQEAVAPPLPVEKDAAVAKPATEKLTVEKPVIEKPVAEKAVADKPAVDKQAAGKLATEKPLSTAALPAEPEKKAASASTITPAAPSVPESPQLLNITFDDSSQKGEMVLFHLTGFLPPTVSAVEKDNPRVICDFPGIELSKGLQENILANGKYVQKISTAKHSKPEKVQVTLSLSPSRDYDLQQVFFKKDNLFVLIINELPAEKSAK
ncbi:MAG: AMIN domain-containing protein [Desulforhopalus sp.]|nr:AMIN domain-containing protein [Desulforhopalus sp.]